ncbi:ABC transporter permease [Chitinophaga pendula]|uniref:MlaE family ABC transporter permease n=1 Tax=Chitinophaga TaxID=79328 RepID=UPI000BB074DD|nr:MULTISPECIES: ABC transporter permease [Chitinophaga]ASZ12686.1 ABC transporter permease [Chitinophaga sp. MD30]UCJ09702.1 ABC transporter permease [Chitinophaga pendula]
MESTEQTEKPVISKKVDGFFISIFNIFRFIGRFFREVFWPPFEIKELIRQVYQVGYKSLALISLTGFITGLVFTKQSRPSLAEFGATSWLPSLISIAVIRALAPLVTALICAGKVGSSIGAELASMKVTEQIDAMEVSAINPFKYLVVTRILATTICLPLLMFYTGMVGMAGSYLDVHLNEQTSLSAFLQSAFTNITFLDFWSSLAKTTIFGFTIGVVSCYQGYNATQGTQGVGKAANISVVVSMFLIFIEEIIIVQLVNSIR